MQVVFNSPVASDIISANGYIFLFPIRGSLTSEKKLLIDVFIQNFLTVSSSLSRPYIDSERIFNVNALLFCGLI